MITVTDSLLVDASPSRVFDLVADPQHQLAWDAGSLKHVEALDSGPLRKGARYRGTFDGIGEVDYEYAEYVPGERFAHHSRLPVGEVYHTFVFEPTSNGTRLVHTSRLEPVGLWKLASPLLRRMFSRRLRAMSASIGAYVNAKLGFTRYTAD